MKRVLTIAAVSLFVFGMTSCKKDYECCYYDDAGVKLGAGAFACASSKMKKSDMEDLQSKMNTTAALWNGSAKCEKK